MLYGRAQPLPLIKRHGRKRGNATVKERANVVTIQLGTLVLTRVSAAALVVTAKDGGTAARGFGEPPGKAQLFRSARRSRT